jgi:chromate transporter
MNPFSLFLLTFKASLFSTGGFGNIPSLHRDLTGLRLATDKTFAEAIAVGQVSPGPNGLWVVSLGYLVGGLAGAIATLVAITIPPLFVLLIRLAYRKIRHHPLVEGFMHGLSLAVVGIFVVVMAKLLLATGLDVKTTIILILSAGLGFWGRVPVVVVLALGALIGYL